MSGFFCMYTNIKLNTMNLSKTSIKRLNGVHPKLQAVVLLAAAQADFPFNVSEGVRTKERQIQMYNEGKSKTLNSRHLIQQDGTAHAVDLYPLTDDRRHIDWNGFERLNRYITEAAAQLGYCIEWGGNWTTFVDKPHYQLTV